LFGSGIVLEKVEERDKGSVPVADGLWLSVSGGADEAWFIGPSDIVPRDVETELEARKHRP